MLYPYIRQQGLEYNSVKVVVTNEIEEQITHNIFYTGDYPCMQKLKDLLDS